MRTVQKGEIYRHFKGNLYQVVSLATHSETGESYVVYQALYGDMGIWVRPYDMFVSEVDKGKYPEAGQQYRFELVSTLASSSASPISLPEEKKEVQENVTLSQSEKEETVIMEEMQESDVLGEPQADKRLLAFLDAETYQDKLNYLTHIRNQIDDRLINDLAAAMDLTVDEGPIDGRYQSLRNCIQTMAKFECSRFR